jgi:hypothetical protein
LGTVGAAAKQTLEIAEHDKLSAPKQHPAVEEGGMRNQVEVQSADAVSSAAAAAEAAQPWGIVIPEDYSEGSSSAAVSIFSSFQGSSVSSPTVTHDCLMSHPNNTVFAALFKNGRILGIPCGSQVPWKSLPCDHNVPETLRPTLLQMTTLHIPWIDRFPFPKMRDNIIMMNAVIDEEDFLNDLFTTESFVVASGTMSWDPNGWVIGKEFQEKWGYLFY